MKGALGSSSVKWVDLKDSEKLLDEGIEYSSFRVRLAKSDADRDAAFKLRYDIFNSELGEGLPESVLTERDVDRFDKYCDHLIVEKNNKVVGTYRLLPGKRALEAEGFYSETEFKIRALPINFKESIEMGRACIHAEHRKQSTLICLMCGIRHYLNLMDCQYLFGLASLPQMSHENALATYNEIRKMGRVLTIPEVEPLPELRIPEGTVPGNQPQIPPLLSVYFNIGTFICAKPAFDPAFKCHDLLSLQKFEEVPERTWAFFEKFARRGERE